MRRSLSALMLPALIPVVLVAAIPAPAAPAHEPAASNFEGFLQELWADAQAQGIARAT
jgi:membrane-bound lytic murein transglycosylase B